MATEDNGEPLKPVAEYKRYLQGCIDRRPSGLRQKLATALGKHKSFVSQITNPNYAVPIPAGDLHVIFEICHLSPEERSRFLALYEQAHPNRAARARPPLSQPHELRIVLPEFRSEEVARQVEKTIADLASRVIRMAQTAESLNEAPEALSETSPEALPEEDSSDEEIR